MLLIVDGSVVFDKKNMCIYLLFMYLNPLSNTLFSFFVDIFCGLYFIISMCKENVLLNTSNYDLTKTMAFN
jgi:hypothetical protein